MKLLVGVTGRAGAGKTTFVRAVEAALHGDVFGLYPGKACREKWGEQVFAEADDPTAPEFSESFVLGLVSEAAAREEPLVLIDGVPRKESQCDILPEIAIQHARVPFVIVLETPAGVLKLRMQARAETEGERALDISRHTKDAILPAVIRESCALARVQVCTVRCESTNSEAFAERAAVLIAGLLEDATVDDGTFSIFHALAERGI